MEEFKNMGLSEEVLRSINALGYTKPTEIQEKMIPLIIKGEDLIGQAQTGTGKTLAYAASILSKIDVKTNTVRAIILTPTRELSLQVAEEFKSLNNSNDFDILPVYGGSSITEQLRKLKHGVDIVVGTPGRVMDLIRRKALLINTLEYFVLDEADEMLDMGFLEDIESIFTSTNKNKQVLMLSATMPPQIKHLAEKYMKKNYEYIEIKSESKTSINVSQSYYLVSPKNKEEVLSRILDLKNSKRSIIFCETKRECDELFSSLTSRGYNAEVMHGDIAQASRIKTLKLFKEGGFNILIATDVAARGIHIDEIDVVINYKLPQDFEGYIHRIGRTGRANALGEAISLVTTKEVSYLNRIAKFANCTIEEKQLPEKAEILDLKYQKVLTEAYDLSRGGNNLEALKYVRDLNKTDLINLASSLLQKSVNDSIGSNFTKKIDIVKKESKTIKVTNDSTRVFINIGKAENLRKEGLIDFIKKESGIDKSSLNNIDILKTFTFIDVKNCNIDIFMDKINNNKYAGRVVRVEKAKQKR